MVDFLKYVLQEAKAKRLSHSDALMVMRQFHERGGRENAVLHPFLHRNTSTLDEQRFSSTFIGDEFFVVTDPSNGLRMLPEAALLEMAREAVKRSTGVSHFRLADVVWSQPLVVAGSSVEAHIGLYKGGDDNEFAYEVYSQAGDAQVIHCQGVAILDQMTEHPQRNLHALKAQGTAIPLEALSGLNYSALNGLSLGDNEVMAQLVLRETIESSIDHCSLHPSLLDGAVQVSLRLFGRGIDRSLQITNLRELQILNKCTSNMWVWARLHEGDSEGGQPKLDIDLCDDAGNVCVRLHGVEVQDGGEYAIASNEILPSVVEPIAGQGKSSTNTWLLQPQWQEQEADGDAAEHTDHVILLCEIDQPFDQVEIQFPHAQCFELKAESKDLAERFEDHAISVFEHVQRVLQNKEGSRVLLQVLMPQGEAQFFSGLVSLLKSVQLENPRVRGQLIELETTAELVGSIRQNSRSAATHVRYQKGKRCVATLQPARHTEPHMPWQPNGVYLVTGGAGGLGLIFTEEIARRAPGATVVLTGRSELDGKKRARLAEFEALGAHIHYKQIDVADRYSVEQLMQGIVRDHGKLSGIIHSAGVIRDNFVFKKTKLELQAVLAPKVKGIINLDLASRDLNLELFIAFSSLAGFYGNVGQADYAAANAFMDSYAQYRADLVASGLCRGRTLSVNWPLWEDGGMGLDAITRQSLQNLGMSPLPTDKGIEALYRALSLTGSAQVAVIEGNLSSLKGAELSPRTKNQENRAAILLGPAELDLLRQQICQKLKLIVGEAINVTIEKIDDDEPLTDYGIDSVMVMQMNEKLTAAFVDLPKTLFYENQTLFDIAEYLVVAHQQECVDWVGVVQKQLLRPMPSVKLPEAPRFKRPLHVLPNRKRERSALTSRKSKDQENDGNIAIIGISGRFPDAETIDKFWEKLSNGVEGNNDGAASRWGDQINGEKTGQRWGVFLDEYDKFDAGFFGISRFEAETMDPQERMFLMSCWNALEDAGYVSRRQSGSTVHSLSETGVFVGVTSPTYNLVGFEQALKGLQQATNISFASISNRVSHFLNLTGPSLSVDTMCSSSLVAVYMACESIRRGECKMAIAGGVNLYLHPARLDMMRAANMLASDGMTRGFGAGGTGFVPGEAVASVILKPLREAIADQDNIYAVIKGGAMGHTGSTLNYMTPKSQAQASLVQKALSNAKARPDDVDYVEMQWSGSDLADSMEIEGLRLGYQTEKREGSPLRVGSVKPNVGHAEAASGMAQLIKVVLQLKNKKFLKTVAVNTFAAQESASKKNIRIQLENEPWSAIAERPLVAGVGSHGAGGTGVHLLLESYQETPRSRPKTEAPSLIVLSAKTRNALFASIKAYIDFFGKSLGSEPQKPAYVDVHLSDLAYTLQTGRAEFNHRWAAVVSTKQELLELLTLTANEGAHPQFILSPVDGITVKRHAEGVAQALVSGGYLQVLAELWVSGMSVDWQKIHRAEMNSRKVALPGYAFELNRYWPQQPSVRADHVVLTGSPAARSGEILAIETLPSHDEKSRADDLMDANVPGIQTLIELSQSVLSRLGFVVAARVYEYLVELGLLIEGGASHISKVTARLSASKESGRVVLRLLELLEREGLIAIADDGSLNVLDGTMKRMGNVKSSRELFLRAAPEYAPCFQLLDLCLNDLLFEECSTGREIMRREDDLVRILTAPVRKGRLSELVITTHIEEIIALRSIDQRETLRVLEIGVGTLEYVSAIAELNEAGNINIDYRIASGVVGVTDQMMKMARSIYKNINLEFLASEDVESYLKTHVVDVVVVRTHDASGIEFLTSSEAIGRIFSSVGLVSVSSSTEDEFVALLLELIFSGHISQHNKVISEALQSGLVQAGYLHEVLFEPVASIYSRPQVSHQISDRTVAIDCPKDDHQHELICAKKRLKEIFSDATPGFENISSDTDLKTLGISSMGWAFVYAKISEEFGSVVDWQKLSLEGKEASTIDAISELLMDKGAKSESLGSHRSMTLAAKVLQRVPPKVDTQLAFADTLSRGLFKSSRGQQIEYYSCGSGPAIIFLTALAFSKSVWENQISVLSERYRLIFPHLPGHAGSKFAGINFSFEEFSDDLAELMSDLGIQTAHLAGWCMAGNISQIFALRHPERLKSLILICTTPTDARLRGLTQRDLEEYSESPLLTYRYEFQNIYNESSFSARIGGYLSVIEQAHVSVETGALLCLMMGLFKFNTTQRLSEISTPTLIFSGAFDIAFPTEQVALLKQGIPHAEYFEFKQGGHLPFLNQSEIFNTKLTNFLGLVDKRPEMARSIDT